MMEKIVNNCIVWTKAKAGKGYGVTSKNGKQVYVHRLAYEQKNGSIPPGFVVAHKCDNPACYNPDHLFACTQKQNLEDMKEKGRSAKGDKHRSKKHPELILKGESIGNSKLTECQIKQIRDMYIPRKVSLTMIAKEFGIAFQTVSKIVNNQSWKHI
jgi:predicted DNA binding protein